MNGQSAERVMRHRPQVAGYGRIGRCRPVGAWCIL